MPWWSELFLLVLAAALWVRGISQRDEVFGLFTRFLAVLALVVVLIAGQPLPLELGLLALALWLPSAVKFDSEA